MRPEFAFQFEWDSAKAESNWAKHGVSFDLAYQVFLDPLAVTIFDDDHSETGEECWATIGRVPAGSLLVLSHTWKDEGPNSARVRIAIGTSSHISRTADA